MRQILVCLAHLIGLIAFVLFYQAFAWSNGVTWPWYWLLGYGLYLIYVTALQGLIEWAFPGY